MIIDKNKVFLEERVPSFQEIDQVLSPQRAFQEAARCLFCYDAPCSKECPAGIDVERFIRKIKTRNFEGAIKVIREANPFGAICARVCPVEQLCEKACIRNNAESSIAIGALQRFITDQELARGIKPFIFQEKKDKSVAIIGAGPSGLAGARELAQNGYKVVVFESKSKPGGLTRHGIPRYRLPEEIFQKEIDAIAGYVEIKPDTEVGKDISWQSLLDAYDAILIACGLKKTITMNIMGEELDGIILSDAFLSRLNSGERLNFQGKRIAVIGGGNTAMDCASSAIRLGSEKVMVIYRRSKAEMPAWKREYELAREEGVEFSWLTLPHKFKGKQQVEKMECIKMRLGETDESGRRSPAPIPGSEFAIPVDIIIEALGQKADEELINMFGIRNEKGLIIVEEETGQTSNPKIFAAGDILNGGKTVVEAVKEGKEAARGIHAFLS